MFALSIYYLTERAVATCYCDYEDREWPPHPARLFSALVATWAATGKDAVERAALEWLQGQSAPRLCASRETVRHGHKVYVPPNDARLPARSLPAKMSKDAIEKHLRVLPDRRMNRQERRFPSVTPHESVVHFMWAGEPPAKINAGLSRLAAKVTYLGHSSSLVSVSVCDQPPEPNLVPNATGDIVLRIPTGDQFSALERAYEIHRESKPRVLPFEAQNYRWLDAQSMATEQVTIFGTDWVVFRRMSGARLMLPESLCLTSALRGAAINAADDHEMELLTGHKRAGGKSETPHVAFVPLANVGNPHADGRLLGVAAVLPAGLSTAERRDVFRALALRPANQPPPQESPSRKGRLTMGKAGHWEIERLTAEYDREALRPETWTAWRGRAHADWATATPVLLDYFPKERLDEAAKARIAAAAPELQPKLKQIERAKARWREAREIVSASLARLGLPAVERLRVDEFSPLVGVPPAYTFQTKRPELPPRLAVHVCVRFAAPVRGTLLVGAGRYFGLGFFRPIDSNVADRFLEITEQSV